MMCKGLPVAGWILLGMLAGASAAQAQQPQRVAILTPSQSQWQPRVFRETLADLGHREGSNFAIEVVSAEGRLDTLPALAALLVKTRPDVIVGVNFPGTKAATNATDRIPIVSAIVGDPILAGVKNIARPEGNVTGVANMATDITSKRVALLKEAVPSLRRVALFLHPDEPVVAPQLRDIDSSAARLGIEYRQFPMRTAEDLRDALRLAREWNADAVVRLAGQGFALGAATGRLATAQRLPSMLLQKADVEAGGLMSYFADHRDLWRRIAFQVDRIVRGAKPSDLPFELPTRFELIINLRTVRDLGIDIPASLLARADEVIE
jgi:putative ABC transport system substrate-binding protein